MSSWLFPILFLAQTRPTQQAFATGSNPRWMTGAVAPWAGCALVRPRMFRRDSSNHLGRGLSSGEASVHRQPLLLKRRGSRTSRIRSRRVQETMDFDGPPEVSIGDGKNAVTARDDAVWQQKEAAAVAAAGATVELPNVQAPVDLPQPGEWLQVSQLAGAPQKPLPLNSQVPCAALRVNNSKKEARVDPFAVPDNDYSDSFVDLLWINLLSSRMATAVEAEAFDATDRTGTGTAAQGGTSGGGGNPGAVRERNSRGLALTKPGAMEVSGLDSAVVSTEVQTTRRRPVAGMGGGYTYEDYVGLATKLQAGAPERQRAVVRGVLRSVFPGWFPAFYRMLFPPSKFSAEVNAFMCPPLFGWLVGKSELAEGVVDIEAMEGKGPSQEIWRSTVKVERCRYLEASKCKGTCMNLCKLPTEAFFREDLGMPLRMTPNFEDLSCEFAFGQHALPAEEDPLMQEPCWTECLSSGKQPKKVQRACHTMPESPLRGP